MRRPPLGRPAGRGAAPAGRRGTGALRTCSEAAGGGICICLRGGPWPPIDVIEPRDPAECKDWFEAIRLRTTGTSGGVGTCVEINQCVGCSSGEEPASPRHRAGVALMAWRSTR